MEGGAQDTVYSAQIQSIFWKGWSFNSVYRHTSLTFPRGRLGLGAGLPSCRGKPEEGAPKLIPSPL